MVIGWVGRRTSSASRCGLGCRCCGSCGAQVLLNGKGQVSTPCPRQREVLFLLGWVDGGGHRYRRSLLLGVPGVSLVWQLGGPKCCPRQMGFLLLLGWVDGGGFSFALISTVCRDGRWKTSSAGRWGMGCLGVAGVAAVWLRCCSVGRGRLPPPAPARGKVN